MSASNNFYIRSTKSQTHAELVGNKSFYIEDFDKKLIKAENISGSKFSLEDIKKDISKIDA